MTDFYTRFAAIVIPLTLLQLLVSVVQAVAAFVPERHLKDPNKVP